MVEIWRDIRHIRRDGFTFSAPLYRAMLTEDAPAGMSLNLTVTLKPSRAHGTARYSVEQPNPGKDD